jgi:hypothetical protein
MPGQFQTFIVHGKFVGISHVKEIAEHCKLIAREWPIILTGLVLVCGAIRVSHTILPDNICFSDPSFDQERRVVILIGTPTFFDVPPNRRTPRHLT